VIQPQYESISYPLNKTYREAEARIEGILERFGFSNIEAEKYAEALLNAHSLTEQKHLVNEILDAAYRLLEEMGIEESKQSQRIVLLYDDLSRVLDSIEGSEAEAGAF